MDFRRQKYSIWIEAECWAEGEWTPIDDNSDAIVTFENGDRWVGSFFSYQNIRTLTEKRRINGERLGGKYFVATDMILVDEVTRERIEEVVADLINDEQFELFFSFCEPKNDEDFEIFDPPTRISTRHED